MNAIRTFQNRTPEIHESCMIDEACVVISEVSLAEDVSVWPCAVLRGDVNNITVGAQLQYTGRQRPAFPQNRRQTRRIAAGYRRRRYRGAQSDATWLPIGNRVLVGMGTTVSDDAVIEDEVMIGAGSLVPPRKRLEGGYLYVGSAGQTSARVDR